MRIASSLTMMMQVVALATTCHLSFVKADTAQWTEPDIDTFFYNNAFGPGSRFAAPSFTFLELNEAEDAFLEGSAADPARLGSKLFAFETSDLITTGLPTTQYNITSVSITAKYQNGTSGSILYTETPITPASVLAEATGSGLSAQLPIELFGVNFRDSFDGFALGPNQTGTLFSEASSVNSPEGYVAYPVIGDGAGSYIDVANNIIGGESGTEPSGTTSPFTATPWSIGSIDTLNEGDVVPNNSTFTFDLDLSLPGVESYVQESLAAGSLGFFLSSLHPTVQPGTGSSGAYPQWYTKEAIGIFSGAEAATLAIEYSLIEELPGDYDQDGDVDSADYTVWQNSYGNAANPIGSGADGNGDGIVDAADYTVWRDNLTASSSALATASAVPEPTTIVFLLTSLVPLFGKRANRLNR